MLEIGQAYGMRAVRVPGEPDTVLRQAGGTAGERAFAAGHAPFAALLRRRVRAAGLASNDRLLGLAWTGRMTEARLLRLLDTLPDGVTEILLHPAAARTRPLVAAMPDYRQTEELDALLSAAVRARLASLGIAAGGYGDLA